MNFISPSRQTLKSGSYHEWFVEFEGEVKRLDLFSKELDRNLQKLNTYYKDLIKGGVLQPLKITVLKKDSFRNYMKSIGKLGGKTKFQNCKRQKN